MNRFIEESMAPPPPESEPEPEAELDDQLESKLAAEFEAQLEADAGSEATDGEELTAETVAEDESDPVAPLPLALPPEALREPVTTELAEEEPEQSTETDKTDTTPQKQTE